jgi:hypothetical protein
MAASLLTKHPAPSPRPPTLRNPRRPPTAPPPAANFSGKRVIKPGTRVTSVSSASEYEEPPFALIGPDAPPASTTRSNNAKDGTWRCSFMRAFLPARFRGVPPLTIFGPLAPLNREELASKIVRDGTFSSAPILPTMERISSSRQQQRAAKRATGDDFGRVRIQFHLRAGAKHRQRWHSSAAPCLEARAAIRSASRSRLPRKSNHPPAKKSPPVPETP